jgi:hypothetical protein
MTPPDEKPEGDEQSYRRGPRIQRKVGIPFVRMLLGRFGVKMGEAQVFEVADPESGEMHTTPLNVLEMDGGRYVVSAKGESGWVRGLRAGGQGRLTHGKESEDVAGIEVPEGERPPIISAYLQAFWKDSKGQFAVDSPDASEEELRGIADQHPVFRLAAK